MQERYGVNSPLEYPEFLEKSKATNRERYGVDWYTQTDECKQRIQETNLERYGVSAYTQTKEYLEYMKNSIKSGMVSIGLCKPMNSKKKP